MLLQVAERARAAAAARPLVAAGVGVGAVAAVSAYLVLWSRTSVVDLSPVRAAAEAAVGAVWLGCSAALLRRPSGTRVGRLLLLGGVLWFLSVARVSNDPWLFTLASGVGMGYHSVGLHIALAVPDGRVPDVPGRVLVRVAYAASVLLGLLWVTVSPGCGSYLPGCPGSQLLVPALAEQPALTAVVYLVPVLLAVAALVLVVRRLIVGDPVTRRAVAPVLVVGVLTVPAFLAFLLETWQPVIDASYYLMTGGLPVAVVTGMAWARWRRTAVGPLVLALDQGLPSVEGIRGALARCLGDPTLQVAFPDGRGGHVDPDGHPYRPPEDPSRVITPVSRQAQVIALLEHHPAVGNDPDLLSSAVAASRLALDNARLTAEVRAQLAELQASRRRVVTSSDEARRRLERDLHDGAQQELLSAAVGLARAREAARAGDASALCPLLDSTATQLDDALNELRRLARGIHPPILTERGLVAALHALAARAPLPVELHATCLPPLSAAVQTAAYFMISEAVTNAARHAEASFVAVLVQQQDDALVVEVRDDGRGGAVLHDGGGLQGLTDRVAAEGGRLTLSSPRGSGTLLRAELPLTHHARPEPNQART